MKKTVSFILAAFAILSAKAQLPVIPRPSSVTITSGTAPSKTKATYKLSSQIDNPEGYEINITPKKISVTASTEAGLFYAKQTLDQLVESGENIPCCIIKDAPRFAYRGLMIDPCRHFETVDAIKRQLDVMARYKLNRFHWHLTDDQGWRVEIKKYPELVKYGATRVEGDGSVHKGYYTQEEIKDVVDYAAKRHITVVPELEMPGHELAAIAAFPELSCRNVKTTPRIIWGVEDIVMCPGKELMFNFLQNVVDELVPLFPGELFHIGGDESPRDEWKNCPKCQARMKELGYTNEAQLQSYIIERMEKYLNKKGKTIIGWDEILEGGNLNPSAIVMSWRGEEGGITAAKAGHKVLMTPSSRGLYFDTYQGEPMVEQSECIWGPCTMKDVYDYDPVPDSLKFMEPYLLGVQANVWHEYIHNSKEMEQRIYPRLFALSEISWSSPENKDFAEFQKRVETSALPYLDAKGYAYHIPVPETVGGSCDNLVLLDKRQLALKTTRPETIIYTLDGTTPDGNSDVYTQPLTFDKTTVVKTAVKLPSGKIGPVRTINIRKTDYSPARKAEAQNTLDCKIYFGNLRNTHSIPETADSTCTVNSLRELSRMVDIPKSIRNVRHYIVVADGSFNMPENGIYEFSSANTEVWIDGQKVIDNGSSLLQRHSRFNAEIALEKGTHDIKVIFIGGIFEGWPTYWDNASVSYRKAGTNNWQKILNP